MASARYGDTLTRHGLQAFLWAHFVGIVNGTICAVVVGTAIFGHYGRQTGSVLIGLMGLASLLCAGYAGHLADTRSKRTVLLGTRVLEVVAMAALVPALAAGTHGIAWLAPAVLFLMAVKSTLRGPSAYGLVPEIVPAEHLSRVNGLLVMMAVSGGVSGAAIGGGIIQGWRSAPLLVGLILFALAVAGMMAALGVPETRPATPAPAPVPRNPLHGVADGFARLAQNRNLFMTAMGIAFLWFLAVLVLLTVLLFGHRAPSLGGANSSLHLLAFAIGVAVGGLAAGRLSGDRIELGLVTIGGFGMGVFCLVLALTAPPAWMVASSLVIVGFAGGLFVVPLRALLQHVPAEHERGRVLAASAVANAAGIVLAFALVHGLGERMGASVRQLFAIGGALAFAATGYLLLVVPDFFVRFVLWMLTHSVYRITIVGRQHIPVHGPALVIANHVSMVDGALVGACIPRFVRFLVWGPHFHKPGIHGILKRLHAIPVTAGNKTEVAAAIERARAELAGGHVVCIFVEGSVSRTGNLVKIRRGFEHIVDGLDVPIIPVYLDRVWGSVFSFKRGRFFWKLPERLPYPVTVAFGAALPSTATAVDARLALMELGSEAMTYRRPPTDLLHTVLMRVAKRQWRRFAMADSTGQSLTFGRLLVGSMLLGGLIRRRTEGQERVGLLMPASVGGAIANIAVLMAGRVPVNLNFTTGPEGMSAAVAQAGIRTIVSSRVFLSKAGLAELPGMVFLEDLRKAITPIAKIRTLVAARLLPVRLLRRTYGGNRTSSAAATIIFSSGSTGVPKGVVLTHANILANIDGLDQIFPLGRGSCFIGVLPFFHSFGFTGTLWFPLLAACPVAYHPNPMDAKTVGELAGTYRASMLISTPTFCQSYLRRCTPEQFAHLKYAIVGAEKLRQPLATAFEERFGLPLLEGYGCTEMSPVVAVNRPNVKEGRADQIGIKFGSVGHPIPGVSAKVVDQNTGDGPIYGRPGMLLVKGPNLMAGYLNDPERTAEVVRNGWYTTGDIAMMDEDGFIFITDRLSRFSKIGGEMVPHVRIEDAIDEILGEACAAVTAVPDETRGERLVAFYTRADVAPGDLRDRLCQTELPRLWIPKREDVIQVDAIPTLGTGKVDLRGLRQLAVERTRAASSGDSGA